MISLTSSVGKNGVNNIQDVKKIIDLLNARKKQSFYRLPMMGIDVPSPNDNNLIENLVKAIKLFQKNIQKMHSPDGVVSPIGNTILFLGGVRSAGKLIIVDLDDQNLYAYDGHRLVYEFYCASGDKVHPTATWPSLYKTFRKHRIYRSKTYDAQMNFAMFFTHDGKAIHESHVVGLTSILKDFGVNELGSHGCVRLAGENASKLFDWAPMHTPVFIDMEKI